MLDPIYDLKDRVIPLIAVAGAADPMVSDAELEAWGVHAAVGGSVKWLCGGPGVGYLLVNPEIADTLELSFTGWQADEEPFAFRPAPIRYAKSASCLGGAPWA